MALVRGEDSFGADSSLSRLLIAALANERDLGRQLSDSYADSCITHCIQRPDVIRSVAKQ